MKSNKRWYLDLKYLYKSYKPGKKRLVKKSAKQQLNTVNELFQEIIGWNIPSSVLLTDYIIVKVDSDVKYIESVYNIKEFMRIYKISKL